MEYVEVPAVGELSRVASHAWYLETTPLRRFEKILPLSRAHVIVNLSEPYRIFDRSGNGERVPDAFISGLQSEYLVIESPSVIRHVGIELLPGGLQAMSPHFAAGSADRVQDASSAFGDIDAWATRLRGITDPSELVGSAMAFYAGQVQRAPSGIVELAVEAIETDPQVRVGALAARAGVSQRHLIASFRAATGMTPKRYSQVLRFHRLIDAIHETEGQVDWSRLAVEHGYHDQPHAIHAFRRFSGWTPAEYVALVAEYGVEAAHFVPMRDLPGEVRADAGT